MYRKSLAIFMLSFLSLITFGSDCYNDFSNRYRICIDDDGKVIVNQQTGKDFYSLKNGRWIVCREKSDCTQLKSEQKKLYFETSVAIHLSGKVSRIVGEDNNPKELCPIELKGSIGVEKGSGETALLNLHQVLQSRVNAVRNEREYHLNHYRNLEKIISDYNKSFSIISEDSFKKSYEYNKYEKPIDYLADLNRYKADLVHAKNELDWLVQVVDVSDFNIALNLEKNKVVKSLFEKFKSQSGFPENIDKIREIFEKKITSVKKEEDVIHKWLMKQERARLKKFEEQIPLNMRFDRLSTNQAREINSKYHDEVVRLIEAGDLVGAKEKIKEFDEAAHNMESILSLQTNSNSRKLTLNRISRFNSLTATNLRSLLVSSPQKNRMLDSYFHSQELENEVKNSEEDRGGERRDSSGDVLIRSLPDVRTGEKVSVSFRRDTWDALEKNGEVVAIDMASQRLIVKKGSDFATIRMVDTHRYNTFIREFLTTSFTPPDTRQSIENYFQDIDNSRDDLNRTDNGRAVVSSTDTLRNEISLTETSKDDAIERINHGIEREARISNSEINFSTDPEPSTNSGVDLDLGETAKYTLYFGISFTPVLGNITNVGELVSMLLTQKDLLGNDVNDVDFVIAGLGILLPPLKNSPKLIKVVKNLMSYIKKAGPKALAVLGKLKSQGKKTFQKVFAGAESLSSFGIDLFSDVSSTIWKYGKGLSDKAKEIGLKTKEQVKDLIEWVGDNVPDLVSSDSGHLGPLIGKYKPAPKNIEAFQGLTLAKRKTRSMGGGLRKRWKDSSGNIYEWDSMHGRVEKYNKKGRHLGEFDSKTGTQTKPADPSRRVEP